MSLTEVNNIKEEYIAYFIRATSRLINKIDTLQKIALQKIRNNNPAEAINLLKRYDVNQEREQLFTQFDEIFLKLSPLLLMIIQVCFLNQNIVKIKKRNS